MTLTKGLHVKDLQEGQQIDGLFLVKEAARGETKSGKPFISLVLADATGEIAARIWEKADQFMAECTQGAVVSLSGLVQAYRNALQIRIDTIKQIDRNAVDLRLFVPCSPYDAQEMTRELKKIVKSVSDPALKKLLESFLNDAPFLADFVKAPAAKAMHHAYAGGLLEHTLAVMRLAGLIADSYPQQLDRSLLITGAFIHDLGKIREFDYASYPFEYSDCGRLVGHMSLGIELLQEKINSLPGFPDKLATSLKHLVLSHHGRYEFGSPVLPMMIEAFILNMIDDLDAKVNLIARLSSQVSKDGYQWTDFQRSLERFLFVQKPAGRPEEIVPGGRREEPVRQRQLFGHQP